MKSIVAATPPTVTEYGKSGFGDCACGEGVAPVASDGVTCPSPVMNSVTVCPCAALLNGLMLPFSKKYARKLLCTEMEDGRKWSWFEMN